MATAKAKAKKKKENSRRLAWTRLYTPRDWCSPKLWCVTSRAYISTKRVCMYTHLRRAYTHQTSAAASVASLRLSARDDDEWESEREIVRWNRKTRALRSSHTHSTSQRQRRWVTKFHVFKICLKKFYLIFKIIERVVKKQQDLRLPKVSYIG